MLKTLYTSFSNWRYLSLAIFIGLVYFFIVTWIHNLSFLKDILFSPSINIGQKILFFFSSIQYFQSGFSYFSQVTTIIIAIFIGINISLLILYVKTRAKLLEGAGLSFGGTVASFLGVGCSACGSVVLSSILGVGGASIVNNFLPFGGKEFNLLSILLLLFSIYIITKKMKSPAVCKVDVVK